MCKMLLRSFSAMELLIHTHPPLQIQLSDVMQVTLLLGNSAKYLLLFQYPQELSKESESEKDKRIRNIKNLYAFELFCQRRFDESLTLFAKLGTGKLYMNIQG